VVVMMVQLSPKQSFRSDTRRFAFLILSSLEKQQLCLIYSAG
jgi:hypothetical protein